MRAPTPWPPSCTQESVRIFSLLSGRATLLTSTRLDKDATDYFRGIVKTGEKSARVLELTEHIIRMNPAHYSVWLTIVMVYDLVSPSDLSIY